MPDKLTPEQRHKNMSAIRAKNTKPEVLVRRFLHAHGYRFRLHEKRLPGTPDIVMKRLHTVILVNGCFWHGHNLALPEGKEENTTSMMRPQRAWWLMIQVQNSLPDSNK